MKNKEKNRTWGGSVVEVGCDVESVGVKSMG